MLPTCEERKRLQATSVTSSFQVATYQKEKKKKQLKLILIIYFVAPNACQVLPFKLVPLATFQGLDSHSWLEPPYWTDRIACCGPGSHVGEASVQTLKIRCFGLTPAELRPCIQHSWSCPTKPQDSWEQRADQTLSAEILFLNHKMESFAMWLLVLQRRPYFQISK